MHKIFTNVYQTVQCSRSFFMIFFSMNKWIPENRQFIRVVGHRHRMNKQQKGLKQNQINLQKHF